MQDEVRQHHDVLVQHELEQHVQLDVPHEQLDVVQHEQRYAPEHVLVERVLLVRERLCGEL